MQLPLGLVNFVLRHVEKRYLRRATDIPALRRRFAFLTRHLFQDPPFATYLPDELEFEGHKVPAEWVWVGSPARDGVLLYHHGGAYVFGGPETHRAMLARLSALTGLRTILPDYRMAPEHPFPAASEDALVAYQALLARAYRPQEIVLGGDSAGGGLTLALLHLICKNDLPRPGAVFAFSPLTDMTFSGESIKTNVAVDPFLPADRTGYLSDLYLAGASVDDPRASPLFGDFPGAPPVLIQVGDTEILLDDSRRMVDRLVAQGVEAKVDVWKRVPHVWQLFQGLVPQADAALGKVARFVDKALRSSR